MWALKKWKFVISWIYWEGMSLEQKENFLKCKTSGLGSPCIMRTVKNHNGEIFIESEPGNGTKVKILFNLKEERYE